MKSNRYSTVKEYRLSARPFLAIIAFMIGYSPLQAQMERLTFSNLSLNGHFGREFDIHDDHIIVYEPNFNEDNGTHKGRAHLYKREGDIWVHDGFLDNGLVKAYSHFGYDVSAHASDLAVSAPDMESGRVFVYSRIEPEWQFSQQLTIPAELHRESPHIGFGENVELNDNWLVVSAPGYLGTDDPITRTGAVFIYKKEGASWMFHQMILPPDLTKSTRFGNDIELTSSSILISASKGDGGSAQSGAVYLYKFEGNLWLPDYTFINPASNGHELFGADADMQDDIIVIGAPMHTEDINKGPQGAAHVYQRFGNSWIRTAFIEAADGKRNDMFGSAVTVADGHIFIGAPRHDEPGKADAGKVYHYVVQDGFWSEKTTYLANTEDVQAHMHFGSTLRLHNHQLVVSGHLMNNNLDDSGIAYATQIEAITGSDENHITSAQLSINPNPVKDILSLTLQGEWESSIAMTIYSQEGHLMGRTEILNQPLSRIHTINVTDYLPGIYFIHANDGSKVSIYKWVKI